MSSDDSRSYSFSASDPMIVETLEAADNQSELIRDAIRRQAASRMADRINDPSLSEDQQASLAWLVERSAGQQMRATTARRSLSQLCQIDMDLVDIEILQPLQARGYIDVITGIREVRLEITADPMGNSDE